MPQFDVTIAGEINLDLILYGFPQELPVERELLASDMRVTLGSSSAILAHNLAALGLSVGFISMPGGDDFGKVAMERLRQGGVDISKTVTAPADLQTGLTFILPHEAQRHILTYPGTMERLRVSDLDVDYLASSRHFHLSSLFLQSGLHPGLPRLFRTLRDRGLTLSLDTNDDPSGTWAGPFEELISLTDIFLPNEDEACRIIQTADVEVAAEYLSLRVPVVAIKCGSRGSLVRRGKERWLVPALSVTPVDTVGAGDSFNSGFLAGFLSGKPLQECARLGNAAAAFSLLNAGGTESFRDRSHLHRFLKQHVGDLWPL